ncbi:MAG: Franean1_4349 family RiPP [Herpetosiphonaceae bacterium]|nr:Franean1_4349 family RiPP [Herpetosiphonaceae bacterium]
MNSVERLIGRAVTDKTFRDALIANPAGTISTSGLSLSADEIARLSAAVTKGKDGKVDTSKVPTKGFW